MEGGFSLSGFLPNPSSLISRGKSAIQDKVSNVVESDTVKGVINKGQEVANKVGLGDKFSELKDKTISKLENVTGLSFSPPAGCPVDRIDTPMASSVLVSTAENPCKPNGTMNSLVGYVVVDSRNPSDYDKKNKNKLWYISISTSAILIGLGILYGQIDK